MKSKSAVLAALCCLVGCQNASSVKEVSEDPEYIVSAYIWPSCHDDALANRELWDKGEGEWEIIRRAQPQFEGQYQPKVPLWGYEMDDDPKVMERWIDLASSHGVNTFAFDWYWFDHQSFLESCLDEGFLKAENRMKMHFYVMWANHSVPRNYWNAYRHGDDDSQLWDGAVGWDDFKNIVDRLIGYFKEPNYLKLDGKPLFTLYQLKNFVNGFGSMDSAAKAMDYLRDKVREAGFPGLHLQLVTQGDPKPFTLEGVRALGVNSVTFYNWEYPFPDDYILWGENYWKRVEKWNEALDVPFFANASINFDDSPRYPNGDYHGALKYNVTPEAFAGFLQRAKDYADSRPDQPKMITIYAFNEWVEAAYLLPDIRNGFSYIDAVKDVMVDGKYGKK